MNTNKHRSNARLLFYLCSSVFICGFLSSLARAADATQGAKILQDLERFRVCGTVLYVAAHPDDENTQLITYLSLGRHYRTAYLSLTRGDGGQNVLGPEFGAELGVIRTQELLAARRIDGGQQFFTRALDFGFSKDYLETLRIWDKQQVLSDIVRVIREYRPDVVITRFSPEPGNTHGHHTASAVLALEAFKLAGDANAFPEQLKDLKTWQPRRILQNGRGGGGIQIDISGTDPVTGDTFSKLAANSRSMHKSQGFGNFGGFGGGGAGARPESFSLLDGDPATKDILDGVDPTWSRYPDGEPIGKLAEKIIGKFDLQNPSASVPSLLELRTALNKLPSDPAIDDKRQLLDRILTACLGLDVSTTIPQAQVAPGESLAIHQAVSLHSDVPVKWIETRFPASNAKTGASILLSSDKPATSDSKQTLPSNTSLSQPYWLRENATAGMFVVDDPSLIGRPENPPAFPVEYVFDVVGQTLVVHDEPVQLWMDKSGKEVRRRLDVVAPVSLSFAGDVQLFRPGQTRGVTVEIDGSRANVSGSIKLSVPSEWNVEPAAQTFQLSAGEHQQVLFSVTAPKSATSATVTAVAEVGGATFDTGLKEIRYEHIPPIVLQPRAQLRCVGLELSVNARTVGYIPGAGDSVAEAIAQMGCDVTTLEAADLTPENLKQFDAVVVGVRAFNVRKDLSDKMPALFDYVEAGGTLIEQYNRPDGLKTTKFAPFDLHLSGDRVTAETAAVTFLAPQHPLLNTPNKITASDFDSWVQERGIYFPNQWEEHWTPLLAMNDPGEQPLKGSLLVAEHGKGHIIYTGLVFFRELPAGVPGSYRLLANLLSIGK